MLEEKAFTIYQQVHGKADSCLDAQESDVTQESENFKKVEFIRIKELELIYANFDCVWFKCALLSTTFLCGMGLNLDWATRSVYTGYATGSFSQHSLLSAVQVVNQVVASISQIIFARLSDHYGRLNVLLLCICFHFMGTIIESQAYGTGTYAAGSIFWYAGFSGITIQFILLMSDFSSLKWRLIFQYTPSLPYVIIPWIVGSIVKAANPMTRWSWDIAMWSFIFPLSSLPLVCLLFYVRWKTSNTQEWKALTRGSGVKKGLLQRINHTFWYIDTIGLILITASLACILVPLTLAGGTSQKWRDGWIIAVLVVGGTLLPTFFVWEARWAINPILSVKQAKDRGIWAPFCSSIFSSMIYLLAIDFLYPVLFVAMNQSSTYSSMILLMPNFTGVLLSPLVAYGLAKIRRTKPFAIVGTMVYTVSAGLFYKYRGGAGASGGVIAACLVLGAGSNLLNFTLIVSIHALSSHDQMATLTAIYLSLASVGSAIGAAISGSLWTQKMYQRILEGMKDPQLALAAFSDPYAFIESYSWGSAERTALVEAYKYIQRMIMTVALALTVPFFFSVFFCKDRYLTSNLSGDEMLSDDEIAKKSDDPILD
ncbi:hypothetical protein HG535_0H04360 [Zygotorulaspora mrakii]|uniref:Major facilitator superfamily (MFS) profile domain-containing protein n=1 Tax=Zygotorulaspora mrakii TaxID=42260 RepID=A0A7H9BAP7_ZYGMR|nr:uncharacterized protein HG535_0H04360 [Zygotorulaspora mrakii]QLG75109.1 hypothetical protein HG535_0H04360 [Zygotorulaspora mrakii]